MRKRQAIGNIELLRLFHEPLPHLQHTRDIFSRPFSDMSHLGDILCAGTVTIIEGAIKIILVVIMLQALQDIIPVQLMQTAETLRGLKRYQRERKYSFKIKLIL